jgi:CRISPR/Cas system-associated endonuclease Cas1
VHADNTIYTRIKNGVVVVSGTGPAIRIDDNRLVIRDGPPEARPLCLMRAEARRRLRHVIVCGDAGGYISFDALRWLRDTGVAFSQLDWNGSVIATSPSVPDVPALRRAQALTCSGVIPEAMGAIVREILAVKLTGQARVARVLGSFQGIDSKQSAASDTIAGLAAALRREVDPARILTFEAPAAALYWQLWKDVPIRFARRNPQRLGPGGRWQPGRLDPWLVFGSRASLLTGQPYRASTPGNAVLNWLYAICQSELTIALRNAGIDPGIGMFHVDMPNRPSLALDAIEALRPYVDLWLFGYLVKSAFANRDFTELRDGEVRLTHPLNAHLAHTAALWRQLSEPVADWLKESFTRAAETTLGHTQQWLSEDGPSREPVIRKRHSSSRSLQQRQALRPPVPALAPLLPALGSAAQVRDEPVPRMCRECGRAMPATHPTFCCRQCAIDYNQAKKRSASPSPDGPG